MKLLFAALLLALCSAATANAQTFDPGSLPPIPRYDFTRPAPMPKPAPARSSFWTWHDAAIPVGIAVDGAATAHLHARGGREVGLVKHHGLRIGLQLTAFGVTKLVDAVCPVTCRDTNNKVKLVVGGVLAAGGANNFFR